MLYKKKLLILILILTSISIFYFLNSKKEINNNVDTEIISVKKQVNETENIIDEENIEIEKELISNTIEIIEKNNNFSNTLNGCNIDFKKKYPEIKTANLELEKFLNENIQEIFKAQLFNNDNFSDCAGNSVEELNYTILTNNENILSIEKDSYSYYAGAAHPNTFNSYHHFNLKTSEELYFTDLLQEDIIENTEDIETLYLLILQNLNITYPNLSNQWWIENPKEIINQETQFYILKNELHIHFNPYDISAYALGHIEISIPLEELKTYLNNTIISLWQE